MEEKNLSIEEIMEAADRLRAMLDEEQEINEVLRKRNKELELLLVQNDIGIPAYDIWHGGNLPMA